MYKMREPLEKAGSNMSTEGAVNDAGKPVTGPFEKTKGWLDWFDRPSKPSFVLPRGAVDAHCHVFGPGGEFPYAPERKYTPCDASKPLRCDLRPAKVGVEVANPSARCPYCNMDLQALEEAANEIRSRAASLIAVSPQGAENSLEARQENKLNLPILRDRGGELSEKFGYAGRFSRTGCGVHMVAR